MPSVMMVVGQGTARVAGLPLALQAVGYEPVAMLPLSWLHAATTDYTADIALFVAERLDPTLIASIAQFYQRQPRPIALSVSSGEPALVAEAIRAGVSALATGELLPQQAQSMLESAATHFAAVQPGCGVTVDAAWEGCKVVERAKGILMRRRALTETAAEGALQAMAMHQAKSVAEVAGTIVDAERRLRQK